MTALWPLAASSITWCVQGLTNHEPVQIPNGWNSEPDHELSWQISIKLDCETLMLLSRVMIHRAKEFQNIVLSCYDHTHMVRYSRSRGLFIWFLYNKEFLMRTEYAFIGVLFNLTPKQTEVISASLSSPLLHKEHRENRLRQADHRITLPQPLRERIGQRWTTFHFSQRLNPSEQFLRQAPPASPQHIHYSCERQGEHVGKLGLAADLWCLINGASVLRLGSSGPESCWVLKWWSDKQKKLSKSQYILHPVIHL